jgi:hypothetical protein
MDEIAPPQSPQIDLRACSGRWVSLHPDARAIVADGATLKEARDAAVKIGVRRPLLLMVPPSKGYFVGLGTRIEATGR